MKRQSQQVVKNWLTAAINQDAKQYCQLMTLDLKEQTTDAQSDRANQQCQQVATPPVSGDLPLRFSVAAEQDQGSTEKVQVASRVPASLGLVKEGGTLKVDQVSGGSGGGEGRGERAKPSPAGKQAETAVKQWALAGVNRDGKKYCQQLTIRYREELTEARSDQATKECERHVASGQGNRLPVVVKTQVTSADPQSAEAAIRASIPTVIELRKEGGTFKVDGVGKQGRAAEGRNREDNRRRGRRSGDGARDRLVKCGGRHTHAHARHPARFLVPAPGSRAGCLRLGPKGLSINPR